MDQTRDADSNAFPVDSLPGACWPDLGAHGQFFSCLRHKPLLDMEPASADKFNLWVSPSGVSLMGGLIRTGTASLDVDFARSMVLLLADKLARVASSLSAGADLQNLFFRSARRIIEWSTSMNTAAFPSYRILRLWPQALGLAQIEPLLDGGALESLDSGRRASGDEVRRV